jgi:serine/threonine protein kinase/tetratricopeptide (TPR) repeat protein
MSDPAPTNVGSILEAYLRAVENGEAPPREVLLANHPACAEELAAALDGLEFVHLAARRLAGTQADDVDSLATKLLGDFRLLREVGRGGMAVVYEAEQVSLSRRVALKVLPFAAVLDPKQLQRFKNEALAAARLQHPNIVPVYAVGCDRGVHYYAMHYVDGESLAVAIRSLQGRAPRGEAPSPVSSFKNHRDTAYLKMAATLGMQAAAALDHAHQLGIVHRDVKPGNLLVDGEGTLWVTDFGLARSTTDVTLTITGELLGTYRYMSPEQAQAKRVPVDHRTDVYSLGTTLYELLTLQPAFPGDDPQEVLRQIATREPVAPRRINPSLPRDLETIVLKAMSKDPSARYSTAQEMAEDLRLHLEGQPVRARRPSMVARSARWSRRHRWWLAAAGMTVAIGLVFMTIVAAKLSGAQKRTTAALASARAAVDEFCLQLGLEHLSLGDRTLRPARRALIESALRFYEEFAPDEHSQLAIILGTLGRLDEAVVASRRAIEASPRDAVLRMHLGMVLRDMGKSEEAIEAFRQAVAIDPDDGYAHYHLAATLPDPQQIDAAIAEYGEAIARGRPEDRIWVSASHSNRAQLLVEKGEIGKARADLDRAIEIDPTNGYAHLNRASLLCDYLHDEKEALREFDRAAELMPDEPSVQLGRGNALGRLGHHEVAILAFDRGLTLDPRNVGCLVGRGVSSYSLGDRAAALADLTHAIELDPKDSQARCDRAHVDLDLGRIPDALADFDAAISADPRKWTALFDRATVKAGSGDLPGALADVNDVLAIEHGSAAAIAFRGQILASCEKYDDALAAYDAALSIEGPLALPPDEAASTLVRRGNLHAASGRPAQALEDWLHAIALGDRSPEALNSVAWTRATARDPKLRNAMEAVERAWQAVCLRPADGNLWNTLGVARCANEEWDEAIGAFARSMKLRNGGDSYDWFFLAVAHARLGRIDEAKRWYEKGVAGIASAPGDPAELEGFRAQAAALAGSK